MEKIQIGKIVNAVALKGEVKVYNYSGYKERYEELEYVFAGEEKYAIEKVRYQQSSVILKLHGIDDRSKAESLKNTGIYIEESQMPKLDEGEFFVRDLIGMEVIDETDGSLIGHIKDVLQNGPQDIYRVSLEKGGEALIPVVSAFVKNIDGEARKIYVHLIEGMIE